MNDETNTNCCPNCLIECEACTIVKQGGVVDSDEHPHVCDAEASAECDCDCHETIQLLTRGLAGIYRSQMGPEDFSALLMDFIDEHGLVPDLSHYLTTRTHTKPGGVDRKTEVTKEEQ